ncbi:lysylphosphatidylglycerol synthase transmembrane domain-containing protein [Haloferax sp. DFSO52]|uniref:lysylphosphatidylglycerol synthase transmembrane domain-containing protein n=1 Tax=Haloferax sp. DFSO52 TaxID=3388505 RepID=UPI003A88E3D4
MSSNSVQTRNAWRTATGIVLALGGFGIYLWVVGVSDVVDAVRSVSPQHLASLVVLGLVPIVLWGAGLWLILRRIGVQVGFWRATLLFAATGFVNAVTPFGQSGGTPVSSLLVAWDADIDYESAFAAVGSLNVFVRLASLTLGVLAAVGYTARLVSDEGVREMGLVVAAATVVFLGGGAILWVARHDLEPIVGNALERLAAGVGRVIPGISSPPPGTVAKRVERFVATVDVLAGDRWRLAAVFALAVFGQISVAAALWTALDALGTAQPLVLVLVVIPLATVSGLVPTPGGIGSAEVVLSWLLVAVMGVSWPLATGTALIYRGTVYWIPTALGAVATGGFLFSTHGAADPRRTRQATVAAFVLAGSISVALIVVVHTRALFVEPTDAVVHLAQDVGLGVLGFAVLWAIFTIAANR